MAVRRGSIRRASRNWLSGAGENAADTPAVSVSVRSLDNDQWMCQVVRHLRDWLVGHIERTCPGSTRWVLAGAAVLALLTLFLLCALLDLVHLYSQFCSIAVPFFAMICGYLLLALGFRHTWTSTGIYLTFCGSVVGETVGFFLSSALVTSAQVKVWSQQSIRMSCKRMGRFDPLFPSFATLFCGTARGLHDDPYASGSCWAIFEEKETQNDVTRRPFRKFFSCQSLEGQSNLTF